MKKYKNISIQHKIFIAIAIWITGGLLFAFLALTVSKWFLVLTSLLFLSIGVYTITLKCPKCHKPVIYNPVYFFGLEIWVYGIKVPEKCSKCGQPLYPVNWDKKRDGSR